MASATGHLERALEFCERGLDQLRVLDEPLGENGVHEVIPLLEAARTELVAILNDEESTPFKS
jgi:hypothetical protein